MNEILDFQDGTISQSSAREFFKKVYAYMFGALLLSGVVAYYAGTPEFFFKYFRTAEGGLTPMYYIVMFSPIGLALLIQARYARFSESVLILLFALYSVLIGLSLSGIFLMYSMQTLAVTFFCTAGAFGTMAVLGYTTKTDLSKMGSLLYMAFIGIFIAGLVNFFLDSKQLGYIISFIGVFVFTGLTAYYMQNLKNIAQDPTLEGVAKNKLAIIGGLQLYILFINLFMSLLNLVGRD